MSTKKCSKPGGSPSDSGFTLVEILAVMAILIMFMALVVPAVSGIFSGRSLDDAGNRLADIANLARESSLARNALTALIVVTDPAIENRYRAVTLMQISPTDDGSAPSSSNWTQISNWETLRPGVAIDPNALSCNDSSDPPSSPGTPTPPFPALTYAGTRLGAYKYIVFLPGGGLLSGSSARLRVTEGIFPAKSASFLYTHPARNGTGAANYYDIILLAATGKSRIDRP